MWGTLKTIFAGGDVIKQGLQLIDNMHTSTEEEIAAKSKARVDLLNAYAPFKIAQRFLAMLFGGVYILSFFLVLSITLWKNPSADSVTSVLSQFYIGEIMLTVIFFYFGGGAFEGVVNRFKKS